MTHWELTDMRGMTRLSTAIQGDIAAIDGRADALAARWENVKARGTAALDKYEAHVGSTETAIAEVEAMVNQLTNGAPQ